MQIITDSFTDKGFTHANCEDYSMDLSGIAESLTTLKMQRYGLAMVSDGCSTGKDTHFGSRLICELNSCMRLSDVDLYVPDMGDDDPIYDFSLPTAIKRLQERFSSIIPGKAFTDVSTFMATLLDTIVVDVDAADAVFRTRVMGDGLVAYRKRNTNDWTVYRFSFANGAPFYPIYSYVSYDTKNGRMPLAEEYITAFGEPEVLVEQFDVVHGALPVLVKSHTLRGVKEVAVMQIEESIAEYDMVMMCSDGIESFMRRQKDDTTNVKHKVEWHVPFSMIAAPFPVVGPGLLRRRAQKFIEKYCPDNGLSHYDDLSVAIIHVA